MRKMKYFSYLSNVYFHLHCLSCILVIFTLGGCYSFTGGSIPPHLKTLKISPVEDNSGYGNPEYRNFLAQELFDKFRNDKSFEIVEQNANANLNVSIVSIREATVGISDGGSAGELESERKITISCKVEYFDAVKKVMLIEKKFNSFGTFDVNNAFTERDEAVRSAISQIADDIMLAVVSGW